MSYLNVRAIRLYYEVHGEGEPVLCIHGLGSDTTTWEHSLSQFSRKYRVVVFENRGAGRSDKPEEEFTTDEMAEDTASFMDELNLSSCRVIGKSMGGMIAQILAVRHPAKVRSLVLACTTMKNDAYSLELLELARTMAVKAGLFETFKQAFLLSYSREYCIRNRERLAEAEKILAQVGNEKMLAGYLMQSRACQKHDSGEIAAKITCPTLVIAGEQDIITPPEQSEQLAAKIPGAKLHLFRGGHGFWREFPDDVNPVVLDFLASH